MRYPKLIQTLSVLVFTTASAQANVRTEIPNDFPGPPAYTQIQRFANGSPFVFTNGEWVAIPFWRDPACVPAGFNLLDLFDPSLFASPCPLTVDGFAIWKNGPAVDFSPLFAHFRGLGAVPIWFVRWSELKGALADDKLTIGELAALPSRQVGYADIYNELFDFGAILDGSAFRIVAMGKLTDGRRFQFSVTEDRKPDVLFDHIRIEFL